MHIASSAGAGTSAALAGRDGRTQADAGRGRGAAHSWKCAGRGREGQGAAGAQRQRHHSVLHRGGAECADFTPCCARTPARTRWGKQEASQKQFGLRCTFFFPKDLRYLLIRNSGRRGEPQQDAVGRTAEDGARRDGRAWARHGARPFARHTCLQVSSAGWSVQICEPSMRSHWLRSECGAFSRHPDSRLPD